MAKKQDICKVNEARHLVVTPTFRVSFPNLFTARSYQDKPDQKKQFKIDMIFDSQADFKIKGRTPKGTTPSMLEAVNNAKVDQWGPADKWPKFAYKVFKNGNDRTNDEGEILLGYEGKFFVTAKSGENFPPKVMLSNGLQASEADIYGGCYAQAALLARPYISGKNEGVRFMLLQVRKVKDGERFGGGFNNEDLFENTEETFDDIENDSDEAF